MFRTVRSVDFLIFLVLPVELDWLAAASQLAAHAVVGLPRARSDHPRSVVCALDRDMVLSCSIQAVENGKGSETTAAERAWDDQLGATILCQ